MTRTAENYAVGASEGDELIGVANYSRGDDPAVAEVAVAVAHDDHLRGVGTALLQHLGGVARRNGIRYFTVDVLVENGLMLKALRDPGRGSATTCGPPEVRVRVDLCGRYGRTPAPQTEANDRGFTE